MTWKIINWWACSHCGLVGLKNDRTAAALKQPCEAVPMTEAEKQGLNLRRKATHG